MRILKPLSAEAEHNESIACPDPSDFRPEHKDKAEFRQYTMQNERYEIVRKTYKEMHTFQTVQYVEEQRAHWLSFQSARMPMMEALEQLNRLVDDSDPDVSVPNLMHAFQTAERIRQFHPDKEWFHLTGLIHDVGKIMALWGQPQWSTVGDTFPVGCNWANSIVHRDTFDENPDGKNSAFNTQVGMYSEGCGLDNVMMSWGHDDYLYHVLKANNTTLPEEALYMIRYHSFYPWHTGGDYDHLCDSKDRDNLKWVLEFNKFDLYSKSDDFPDMEALRPYYQGLIDKYIPGELKW